MVLSGERGKRIPLRSAAVRPVLPKILIVRMKLRQTTFSSPKTATVAKWTRKTTSCRSDRWGLNLVQLKEVGIDWNVNN